jgi:Fic family protein
MLAQKAHFLNGVAVQSEDVLSRAERINELLNQWKIEVASSVSQVPINLVQHFAVNPYFTTNKIATELGIAYSTAQRGIQKLEAIGIIKKINDNKRDKVYCATQILHILEEPTKIRADTYE